MTPTVKRIASEKNETEKAENQYGDTYLYSPMLG